ncbi:uncharacterized protein LOC141657323 isoform X2 [Silene latifolia]|uniref:uncharacterized protein LOC141657323 isoform X2 n=1 Tax=Silene latifolia TaxID=37657 RepID=UPI003D772D5B
MHSSWLTSPYIFFQVFFFFFLELSSFSKLIMAEATILPVVRSIIHKLTVLHQTQIIIKSWSAGDYETIVELVQDIGGVLVLNKGNIWKENSPRPTQLSVPFPSLLSKLGLKDAGSKQMGNVKIKLWLQHTKRRLNEIDDLLDVLPLVALENVCNTTDGMPSLSVIRAFNPVWWPPKMPHIRHELEKIVKQSRKRGLTGDVLEASMVQPTHRLVEECEIVAPKIVGRDKEKMEIIMKLLALGNVGGPSVVAVYGVGGIGKTALAKLVYEDADDYHFDFKLWVSDSVKSDVSISRVLRGIIESATGEITLLTASISELVNKIRLVFKDKRYLLVLDDVWVENNPFWMELKSILDVGKPGNVILITTRNLEVAFSANSVENYHLGYLPLPACWSIFKRLAFRQDEEEIYPRLCVIGESIVKKWAGLPTVANWLGNMLRSERDEEYWRQIDEIAVSGIDDVVPLLKLAYDNLPSHLKPCFAHLALSQGEINCVRSDHIFIWSALGLLPLQPADDEIEIYGQTYLKELLSRSILYDCVWTSSGRFVSGKMHDLFHEFAKQVLGEDLAVITRNSLTTVSELSRHIIWGYEKPAAFPNKGLHTVLIEAKKARTFKFGYPMSRIKQSFVEEIISNLRCLYILDLGHSHFEELPSSIGDLKHLRVLNMSFNPIIKCLPHTVSGLWNLQALYLEGCKQLQNLPMNGYGWLSLKFLSLTTCQTSLVRSWFNFLLPDLQELHLSACKSLGTLWETNKIGRLKSLKRLHIQDCPQLAYLPNSMKRLVNLNELVIANCDKLDLDQGEGLNDLKSLQSLEISGIPRLTCLPDAIISAATSLEYFLLRDCIQLVQLPNWLLSFKILQSFAIYNCPMLLTLPEGVYHLKNLKELKIKGCPHLSRWCFTPRGFFLVCHIPHIQIDGRLITRNMNKEPNSSDDNEASTSSEISEFGVDTVSSLLDSRKKMSLHLCLFAYDDHKFERETLLELWMAAGYSYQEENARIYFDSFVREGLILKTDKVDQFSGKCKYVINRDKVSIHGFYTLLKDENTEGRRTNYRHILVESSCVNQSTFEMLKRCKELRTLMFIRNYGRTLNQLPSDLFLSVPFMETLDLSGSHITELPSSIGNLTRLRYLDLSFTLIKRLPETIDRLVKLQTLKLKGCNKLYTLPKGMKKLICLRHLYFDVLGQLSFMPRGIGALTELRTLSAFIVDAEQGCNIRELRNLNNLSGSCCISGLENVSANDASLVLKDKKHLTQIILRWDGYGATDEGNVSVPVWYLEPHCCLENLELFCYPKPRLPDWICDQKFKNLTSITFIKCENKRLITLGSLPNLNYLGIIQMNNVITIDHDIHAGHVSFPKLKKLTIDGMLNLASWTATAELDFPLLAEVSIKYCPKIYELPFLAFLSSLETLEISHCTALESLSDEMLSEKLKMLVIESCSLLTTKYSRDGEHWHKIEHVPEIWFDLQNIHSPSEDGHSSVSEDAE